MKRFFCLALLVAIVAPIGFSGCAEEPKAPATTKTEPVKDAPKAP
jgi:hypothetical protein